MLAAMFTAAGRRVWLGGNIGKSLLGELNQIEPDDWVVLELSSFQLTHLSDHAPLPQIAVVTNFTPNHLDWHGNLDDYLRAKQRIVREQSPSGVVVLNPHDVQVAVWSNLALERARAAWPLEAIPILAVPGVHNRHNAACAAAAATAAGVAKTAINRALRNFRGLDHRLQFVAEVAGRRFYNDSKSTTPQATIAALAALDGPLWLLSGGYPKDARFEELARAIVQRTRGAGLFGQARESLHACLQAQRAGFNALATEQLADALDWCWRQSQSGDVILLSPACASYDQFRDFEARGETYCRCVAALR